MPSPPSQSLAYTNTERMIIIASAMLGFALDLYDVLIFPFLIPSIQRTLGLSLTQVGSIQTLTLIGSVVGGAIFGWLGDRLGRKTSLQITLGLFAVGSVLGAFSWNYWSMACIRFLTGIGLGGEWGAGMVLFNEAWNPRRRGLGSAFVQGSAVLGSGFASVVAIWAISSFSPDWGWRVALLTGGSPIILMVLIRIFMPESKAWLQYNEMRRQGQIPLKETDKVPLLEIFRPPLRSVTITGLVWMMSYMLCYYSIVTFMPTLMLKYMNTPPKAVRAAAVTLSIVSGIAYIANGWFHDRFGRRVGAIAPAIVWVASLTGMYFWGLTRYQDSVFGWPLYYLYAAFGIGNVALGVAGTWLSELYPLDLRSTAVSTLYMAGRALGSIAPVVVPLMAMHLGGKLLYGMLIASLPAALVYVIASLCLPETAGRELSYVAAGQSRSVK